MQFCVITALFCLPFSDTGTCVIFDHEIDAPSEVEKTVTHLYFYDLKKYCELASTTHL